MNVYGLKGIHHGKQQPVTHLLFLNTDLKLEISFARRSARHVWKNEVEILNSQK